MCTEDACEIYCRLYRAGNNEIEEEEGPWIIKRGDVDYVDVYRRMGMKTSPAIRDSDLERG